MRRPQLNERRSVLQAKLEQLIQTGSLSITWPNGRLSRFGPSNGPLAGPDVAVRLSGALTPLKLALHPDLT
jgi:hypothetical protein